MKFVSKQAWGSNQSKEATEDSHPIGSTRGITTHWEGAYVGTEPHSACAQRVRNIERSHEYGRGWGDIAYSLLVCQHGYVFEGRGAGVRSAANGYTAANDSHYAVCGLAGPGDEFTELEREGFLHAFAYLRDRGSAGAERNGHRDHKATQCPGDARYRWVRSLPAGAGEYPRTDPTQSEEDDMAFLDEPLNVHDPRGRKETQNVTVREALTASVIRTLHGEDAARVYLEQAQKSAAPKE